MCASAVSMVSIHPHSRCKLKRPGARCMLYAVCCFCKGFCPPLVDAVQGELTLRINQEAGTKQRESALFNDYIGYNGG